MTLRASKILVAAVDLSLLLAAAVGATPARAEAMADYESPYGYERTWNAAMRLVRVDNGWKITEKDEGSGYLLFEYRSIENSKALSGSIELVKGTDADAPVDVLVRIPQMPHYHEQVLVDSLSSKMRREYGDPPQHATPAPEDPGSSDSPDAGDTFDE